MPSTPGNPYLDLLAGGLAEHGVRVDMARGAGHVLPFVAASLGKRRPDVFHLHWTQPYLYWPRAGRPSPLLGWRLLAQLRLLRRRGIRIVWTLHNIAAHESDDPALETGLSRSIAELCNALIVHCTAARDAALAELGGSPALAEKVHVIPHGNYIGAYPDDIAPAEARSRLGLDPGQRVFLFFGRLRRYKGAQDLLHAFRRLPGDHLRLVLAGRCRSDDVRREVERLARQDERVLSRLEYVPDDDVQLYMRAADVAVLPFRDVLTSGSVVLAMSFGLPVVAPSLGCLPETLTGQAHLLYDAEDPNGLGRTLELAMSADLSAIGASNRAAVEPLDWAGIGRQTMERAYGVDTLVSEPAAGP